MGLPSARDLFLPVRLRNVVPAWVGHSVARRDLVASLISGVVRVAWIAAVAVLSDHEGDRTAAVAVAWVAGPAEGGGGGGHVQAEAAAGTSAPSAMVETAETVAIRLLSLIAPPWGRGCMTRS